MDQTPNLALPLIAPDQAQKHLTHNEALRVLDAVVHLRVIDRDLSTPPAASVEGDRYIVGAAATGAWAGQDARVAAWQDGGWLFYPPRAGWIAFVHDEGRFVAWSGAAWVPLETSVNPATLIGINTSADLVNRLAVKSDAVLLSHDDVTPGSGNVRVTINKALPANDAALTFQTGYSARALLGTLGDDQFALKVSPDGSTYFNALIVNPATGAAEFPRGIRGTSVNGSLQARANGAAALIGRAEGFHGLTGERYDATNNPSMVLLQKGRGTIDAPAPVLGGDGIGGVTVRAYDGVGWVTGGQFRFNVDTFNGINDYSANWRLDLRNGTVLTTVLMVTSAFNFGVGTATPTTKLHVTGPIRHQVYTVATLPAAATVGAGTRAAVTDASAPSFGAVVAGGGTAFTPVVSDGTNWRVG